MALPVVTWWVYHINCDCCAYAAAYSYAPRWKEGPRCRFCRGTLGPMQYTFMCKVKARSEFEAIEKMHEWWRRQNKVRVT